MRVFRPTRPPVELSLIVDDQEIIGELIDWSKFFYSEITDTWMAEEDTIRGVQELIELRQ